jgi:hypothetical protein
MNKCTFCELRNLKKFWRYECGDYKTVEVVCLVCHRLLQKDDIEAVVWRRLDLRTLAERFKHRNDVSFMIQWMETFRYEPIELVIPRRGRTKVPA